MENVDLLNGEGELRRNLVQYGELLLEANKKCRLVGPDQFDVLWSDHILDSLHFVRWLSPVRKMIDVGTGGGLPGVVFAAAWPDCHVELLDSLDKKTKCLEEIVQELGLKNAQVVRSRVEVYAQEKREFFDLAVARAVTSVGVLLEYLSPLVAVGGIIALMKGPSWVDEVAPIEGGLSMLGLEKPQVSSYKIGELTRWVLIFKKTHPCSEKFPRRVGVAEKRGWWKTC